MLESELAFLQHLREAIDKYLFLGFAPSGRTPGGTDPASEKMSEALQKPEFQALRQRISEAKPRAKAIMAKFGISPVLEQYAPPLIGGGLIARQHILDVVTDNMTWQRVEKEKILDPIDQAIGAIRQEANRMEPGEAVFDPWGPISAILFDFGSDLVIEIVSLAGLTPDWALTPRESYSHTTRNRAFRGRVDAAYKQLDSEAQRRFVLNVAREIGRRDPDKHERLNEALRRIGWSLIGESLVPVGVLKPEDLQALPDAARADLAKAADRLSTDPTGAISAACGAVDTVTADVFETHKLGKPGERSFQERVNLSMQTLGVLGRLQRELEELGWDANRAREFCHNLKGSISQAAKVMETLRSQMGDVHGSKPTLEALAFDSIRWAMILCSLLKSAGS